VGLLSALDIIEYIYFALFELARQQDREQKRFPAWVKAWDAQASALLAALSTIPQDGLPGFGKNHLRKGGRHLRDITTRVL
jgi:hypothetical protein